MIMSLKLIKFSTNNLLLICATKPAATYETRSILYVHQKLAALTTIVRWPLFAGLSR
jgi:hypothetical protein